MAWYHCPSCDQRFEATSFRRYLKSACPNCGHECLPETVAGRASPESISAGSAAGPDEAAPPDRRATLATLESKPVGGIGGPRRTAARAPASRSRRRPQVSHSPSSSSPPELSTGRTITRDDGTPVTLRRRSPEDRTAFRKRLSVATGLSAAAILVLVLLWLLRRG